MPLIVSNFFSSMYSRSWGLHHSRNQPPQIAERTLSFLLPRKLCGGDIRDGSRFHNRLPRVLLSELKPKGRPLHFSVIRCVEEPDREVGEHPPSTIRCSTPFSAGTSRHTGSKKREISYACALLRQRGHD